MHIFNIKNRYYFLFKHVNKNLHFPCRAQIYVGFQCHQKCGFCYYKYKCNEPMFSLDYIKKQIDFEYEYGIRDFEITGGEPSEYNQLRDVCQYIKSKNKDSKIAIITNGGLWKCNVWDLIDEVLVSYHISKYDPNINNQFFPLGHTYDKVKKTIDLARQTNKLIRTNTILGKFNINGIKYIVDDLIGFKPNMINFLPVNIFDQAKELIDQIDYIQLRPILKQQLDKIKTSLLSTYIYIRYMPFCDMEGYEQHIMGNLQHIFDWFDWCRELDGPDFLDYIGTQYEKQFLNDLGPLGLNGIRFVVEQQQQLYYKSSKCLKCKYLYCCDGIEKHKNQNINEKQIVPIYGIPIKNFMEFVGDNTYIFYQRWYLK